MALRGVPIESSMDVAEPVTHGAQTWAYGAILGSFVCLRCQCRAGRCDMGPMGHPRSV